jgi:hypothetical protein
MGEVVRWHPSSFVYFFSGSTLLHDRVESHIAAIPRTSPHKNEPLLSSVIVRRRIMADLISMRGCATRIDVPVTWRGYGWLQPLNTNGAVDALIMTSHVRKLARNINKHDLR